MTLGLVFARGAAADAPTYVIAPFSAAAPGAPLPAPWRLTTLPGVERATQYALIADEASVVLRANAQAAMASITHPLKVDPDKFPFISWRWKISNVLQTSDLRSKTGDDFPARVYVLFDFDIGKLSILQRARMYLARKRYGVDVPSAALCYVWDGKEPVGTAVWSPYTDRVRVIVVRKRFATSGSLARSGARPPSPISARPLARSRPPFPGWPSPATPTTPANR